MANLVPITPLQPMEERIIEFRGLNRKHFVEDGEMSDMKNLTSDNYPLLCPRKLRGQLTLPEGVAKPLKIMTKYERIAMIAKKTDDSIAFFYDGNEITSVTGLTEDTEMVAINTKICFFPQKTYLSLVRGSSSVTVGEFGSLDSALSLESAAVTIGNENVTLTVPSGHGFKYDDAIDLNGTLSYTIEEEENDDPLSTPSPDTPGVNTTITKECIVSCIIESATDTTLILPRETFIELTAEGATGITFTGSIGRDAPALKHVIEWNNRLWGVSDTDNTVYACKLGDPTNWKYFQGTALDSYYAQQGTDENWTGSAAYSGHLIFFKPNSMTKIYGTSPSSFQITNTVCYGVEPGSSKSVAIVNDTVFYKSSIGIMAYDGGTPYSISDRFNIEFGDVVGGTEGRKYYASIKTADGEYELMVLDVDKGLWHKEDDVRFRSCCTLNGMLYFIEDIGTEDFEQDKIYIINPDTATETKMQRDWMATFGAFDELIEDRKIYSRMSLRFIAQPRTVVSVYIKMDDGEWELVKKFAFTGTGGETVPIVPRRCDRFYIKIVGKGDCEIKTLTRRFRRGSKVKA